SNSIRQTYYQYFLEGFSTDWSPWAPNSKVLFTNLEHGDYTLRVNAQFGNGNSIQTLTRNFTIEPLLHETGIAYSAYILLGVGFVYLGFAIYSRRLKYQNLKLERMIFERTHEIELKNRELEKQAEMMETKNLELATQSEETLRNSQELASALAKLQNAQDQLLVTARKAGMAEVATNVLHNVGNVLNSINIGIVNLATKISKFRGPKLEKIVELINENRRNLGDFITQDPKGSAIPDYLAQLSKVMMEEFESCLKETDGMKENIDHVKRIIAAQQAHAKNVDVIQEIDLNELVDSAIDMILGDTKNSACKVMLDLQPELVIESDKHKILQILTNFVKNAKEAIKEAKREVGYINIEGKYDPPKNSAILTISDNGIGIENEDLQKIFTHGFTTKADGHGFGMHSCANNVKTLGGELMIESRGKGHGATVILILPRHANTQRKEQSKERTKAL
ncbi:MAG: ATP-binding protein, partial [Verrucomicrobiota bacterium]